MKLIQLTRARVKYSHLEIPFKIRGQCFIEELTLPRLKLKVEAAVDRYLAGQFTDDEFKASVQAILAEFEGKNLLHQNIGQLTWMKEKGNPSKKHKFERIWVLLDQVNPRIGEAFDRWFEKRSK